jgi:hypothetical protein
MPAPDPTKCDYEERPRRREPRAAPPEEKLADRRATTTIPISLQPLRRAPSTGAGEVPWIAGRSRAGGWSGIDLYVPAARGAPSGWITHIRFLTRHRCSPGPSSPPYQIWRGCPRFSPLRVGGGGGLFRRSSASPEISGYRRRLFLHGLSSWRSAASEPLQHPRAARWYVCKS